MLDLLDGEDPAAVVWDCWLTDAALDRVEALTAYGAQRGLTLLEVAVGGLAALPATASSLERAQSAILLVLTSPSAARLPNSRRLAETSTQSRARGMRLAIRCCRR